MILLFHRTLHYLMHKGVRELMSNPVSNIRIIIVFNAYILSFSLFTLLNYFISFKIFCRNAIYYLSVFRISRQLVKYNFALHLKIANLVQMHFAIKSFNAQTFLYFLWYARPKRSMWENISKVLKAETFKNPRRTQYSYS